jgi:hypothetical protein
MIRARFALSFLAIVFIGVGCDTSPATPPLRQTIKEEGGTKGTPYPIPTAPKNDTAPKHRLAPETDQIHK